MFHQRLTLFLLLACAPLIAEAELADFPETLNRKSTTLAKVGEGTFKWTFFKIYDGALYLDRDNRNADPLADVAKCLTLEYNRELTAEQFRKSGSAIVERNVDAATWESLQDELAQINAAYKTVGKGDRYSLVYAPGEGTTLELNGEPLVTVKGEAFARAYFSIWLGGDPAKKSFRDDLLGE